MRIEKNDVVKVLDLIKMDTTTEIAINVAQRIPKALIEYEGKSVPFLTEEGSTEIAVYRGDLYFDANHSLKKKKIADARETLKMIDSLEEKLVINGLEELVSSLEYALEVFEIQRNILYIDIYRHEKPTAYYAIPYGIYFSCELNDHITDIVNMGEELANLIKPEITRRRFISVLEETLNKIDVIQGDADNSQVQKTVDEVMQMGMTRSAGCSNVY